MIVERAIQHTHIADASFTDAVKPMTDILYGEHTYRVAHPTHTEGTRIETSSGSLYLHEGLTPGKQRTLLRSMQGGKIHHPGKATIVIRITQPLDIAPYLVLVPHIEPLGKTLLTLATQHTIHLGMLVKIGIVVAQELGATQYHYRLWHQSLHTGNDM